MRTIGLTGGIACGKSTVASLLRKRGVPVLDADQVARDVVAVGTQGLEAIKQRFGPEICQEDGSLNRVALRQTILADSLAKQDLEAITHPLIFAAIQDWQHIQKQTGSSVIAVEAALMVETGSYRKYDGVIVVSCEATVQQTRLMRRNQVEADEAVQWIKSQMPLSQKESVADWVIYNNSDIDALEKDINDGWDAFLYRITQRSAVSH